MKGKIKWVIASISFVFFLIFTYFVVTDKITVLDDRCHDFISNILDNNGWFDIMKVITWFGGALCLVILAFVLGGIIKNKRIGIAIICNLAIIKILNIIIKVIVERDRPGYMMFEENETSFPSGHAMVGLSFYGFLIFLTYRYIENKKLKVLLITLLTMMIILIGFSRIYFGVHYTSDVLGGFSISLSYLICYTHFITKFMEKEV